MALRNADEKRLALAWLALGAPLPLPLNDVLEWPALIVYCLLVVRLIQRTQDGATQWLENRHLNGLGLLYLPIFAVDIHLGMSIGRPLKPLLHLVLFVTLAKLWSMRRERDKWQAFVAIFVIFLAAMATSTHLTVTLYLVAGIAGGLWLLGRFAQLHVAAVVEQTTRAEVPTVDPTATGSPTGARRRRLGWAGVLTAFTLLVAIPLFATMPRLREPFIMGRGQGLLGAGRATGFSDSVDLNLTSAVRDNPAVALRIETEAPLGSAGFLRLKGGGYAIYRDGRWLREGEESVLPSPRARFTLPGGAAAEALQTLRIYQEPMDVRSLLLPTQSIRVAMEQPTVRVLGLDPGGVLNLPGLPPRRTIVFEAELGRDELLLSEPPTGDAVLDTAGVTPQIAELAAEVMGTGDDATRIRRLERHLLNQYDYTLDFVGRSALNPIEDFLFTYRSGHCEYFATAMVLMLRAEGIPARFVTGFLGAEQNRLEGFYVVRQRNAHAWVEAWTDDGGWRVYDPTPPEGRPGARADSLRLLAQQLWDFIAFRWDRYVLTYGAEDQRGIFERLGASLRALWEALRGADEDEAPREEPVRAVAEGQTVLEQAAPRPPWQRPWVRYGGLALVIAFLVTTWLLLRRRPPTAESAYVDLRAALAAAGAEVDDATPPLVLRRRGVAAVPRAAPAIGRIVDLYVAHAFAARPPSRRALAALRDDLETVRRAVMAQVRAERRARRTLRRAA
ncbi:MAG: DUF3488 and transglutaminase-like domain-containing protein [Acidobacteriota bacterium]